MIDSLVFRSSCLILYVIWVYGWINEVVCCYWFECGCNGIFIRFWWIN